MQRHFKDLNRPYRWNLMLRNLSESGRHLFFLKVKTWHPKPSPKDLKYKKLGTVVRKRLKKFLKRCLEYKNFCKLR